MMARKLPDWKIYLVSNSLYAALAVLPRARFFSEEFSCSYVLAKTFKSSNCDRNDAIKSCCEDSHEKTMFKGWAADFKFKFANFRYAKTSITR